MVPTGGIFLRAQIKPASGMGYNDNNSPTKACTVVGHIVLSSVVGVSISMTSGV